MQNTMAILSGVQLNPLRLPLAACLHPVCIHPAVFFSLVDDTLSSLRAPPPPTENETNALGYDEQWATFRKQKTVRSARPLITHFPPSRERPSRQMRWTLAPLPTPLRGDWRGRG